MASGHLKKRGKKWSIILEFGRDPDTGKRKQRWITFDGTKREAQAEMARLISELHQGTYVAPSQLTVADYLTQWLEDYVKQAVRMRVYEDYRAQIELHITPRLGRIKLSDLTPTHLQQHYKQQLESGWINRTKDDQAPTRGLSPRSVRMQHAILHKALKQAVEAQILARNPADAARPPKASRYKYEVYDREQVLKLFKALEGHWLWGPVMFALSTGLRRSEILGLQKRALDLDAGKIHIERTLQRTRQGVLYEDDPKTDHSRRAVAVSDTAVNVLRKQLKDQAERRLALGEMWQDMGYVFDRGDGAPINPSTFSRAFGDFLNKHEFPHIRLHDLRHSHATLLLEQGVHPKIVSERLGHSSITITLDTYSHVLPGLQEAAAAKLDDHLFGQADSQKRSQNMER